MTEPTRRCALTTGPRDETMLPQELAERLAAVGAAYPPGSPTASKSALGVVVEYLLSNGCADAVEELERLVGAAGRTSEPGGLEATAIFVDEADAHALERVVIKSPTDPAGAGAAAIAVERAVGETTEGA